MSFSADFLVTTLNPTALVMDSEAWTTTTTTTTTTLLWKRASWNWGLYSVGAPQGNFWNSKGSEALIGQMTGFGLHLSILLTPFSGLHITYNRYNYLHSGQNN